MIDPKTLEADEWLINQLGQLIRVIAVGTQSVVMRQDGKIFEVTFKGWQASHFWRGCRVVAGAELQGYLIRDFEAYKRGE